MSTDLLQQLKFFNELNQIIIDGLLAKHFDCNPLFRKFSTSLRIRAGRESRKRLPLLAFAGGLSAMTLVLARSRRACAIHLGAGNQMVAGKMRPNQPARHPNGRVQGWE